ncbi:hypothetical protein C2S51_035774 [Perilla frutescens var. frutescens]|nr:hypothetical protein C2S51_035774 [Perilla frutescens var. frutescens]
MKREFVPGLKDALLPDIKEYIKSLWHSSKRSRSQRSRSNEGPPPMHDQEKYSQPSQRSVHVEGSHRERDLLRRSPQVEESWGSRQIEGSRGSQHRDAPRKEVELEGIFGSPHSHAYGPQFSQHVGIPYQELDHAYGVYFGPGLVFEEVQASPPVIPCSSKGKQVEESSAPVESRSKEATLAAYKDWHKGPKSSQVFHRKSDFPLAQQFFERIESMKCDMTAQEIHYSMESLQRTHALWIVDSLFLSRQNSVQEKIETGLDPGGMPEIWRFEVYDSMLHKLSKEDIDLREIQLRPLLKLLPRLLITDKYWE